MATGDTIEGIFLIGAGARLEYQPAVGVEILITQVSSSSYIGVIPNRGYEMTLYLRNAILSVRFADNNLNPTFWNRLKFLINNTNYISIRNDSVGAKFLQFSGVYIK